MAESLALLHSLIDNVEGANNKGKEGKSARKLAANLWEINGLHSPSGLKNETYEERPMRRGKSSQKVAKLPQSDPHSPVHHDQQINGSKARGHRRRSSATSQKLEITEYVDGEEVQKTVGNANIIEVSSPMAGSRDTSISIKTRLKDLKNSLIASKELVRVLFRFISQEEQHSSRITLVSALKVELDRARLQVDRLIQEQRTNSNQIEDLLKHFAEETAAWKSKERERIRDTVSSLAREIEIERKLRKQSERLNKKLGKELADTRADFSRVIKELDGERRAREILEQTCDELARGIGEERVEVEELKRESEKAREEVEKERQMLQLADVLREERVQMKLAEAKYEYEEKNSALERLKSEIEAYMKTKESRDDEHEDNTTDQYNLKNIGSREGRKYAALALPISGQIDKNEREDDASTKSQRISSGLQEFLSKIEMSLILDRNGGEVDEGEDPKRDSGDSSELHSIELNMENNKTYKWNFASEENNRTHGESRRASVDEMFKGRRSLSEKIQWENICLQKKTSDGSIEWNNKEAKNINGIQSHILHGCEENENENDDAGFKRFKPAINTGNSSHLREACSAILQDLASRTVQLEENDWVNIK